MATAYFALRIIRRLHRSRLLRAAEKYLQSSSGAKGIEKKICRICLKDGTIPIYGGRGSLSIAETIRTFGDIELSCNDDFPKHLCVTCQSLLHSAIQFRNLAKESNKSLLESQHRVEVPIEGNNSIGHQHDVQGRESDHDYESLQQSPSIYRCKLCRLNFNSSSQFVEHQNSKMHRSVRIQCPICKKIFTASRYRRHQSRHASATHMVCEVCGKMYRKDNLLRHLALHSSELPFKCQLCPYRGRFADNLKIHMRTHTGDRPFNCSECQLRFSTRSNLNKHNLTHRKDRPFKCPECGKGFYTQGNLGVHFRSDHAGLKDFGCNMCGNKYGTKKALMRHELRVHNRKKMAKGRVPLYLQTDYVNAL